ncbi:MAG: DHH family phosphoesterase [Eubacterium sp.]|jgi:phosphoesterase RecJ-like protein
MRINANDSERGTGGLREIAEALLSAGSVALFPHENMDGDAIGSCVALSLALKSLGKRTCILIDERIPDNLKFFSEALCTKDFKEAAGADVSLCVDSSSIDRIGRRADVFRTGKTSVCIDHHRMTKGFCEYNYIESDCPATAQIVFRLIKELGVSGTPEIGEAIFVGITTDTGDFQYQSTNEESHLIAAELYEWGTDTNKASIELYEHNRLERIRIENKTLDTLVLICGGRAGIAYVTQEMLKETGAYMDETDRIANRIRSIDGIEVSVLLKEESSDCVKVSMRSKCEVDVSAAAAELGGGGHARAAGATLRTDLSTAFDMVRKVLSEQMEGDKAADMSKNEAK